MQSRLSFKLFLLAPIVTGAIVPSLMGQRSGVVGYWQEPQGSVIRIDTCGENVCATLVAISPSAPARVDGRNPNPDLRRRSLCGLRIGGGFHLTSADKADGGSLYDPKSGKTYHGIMTAHGDHMDLRGYIGIAVFGRTERWIRTEPVTTCT